MNQPDEAPFDSELAGAAEALGYYDAEDFEPDDLNDSNDWEWAP